MSMRDIWRPMASSDLASVDAVAEIVHPLYPESREVAAERLALYPAGCLVAVEGGRLVGYAIGHPGVLGRPPALDTLLGTLPAEADCLYLHDVALLPDVHGKGHGKALIARLESLARSAGLARLALTAVNNSAGYWARHGFAPYKAGDADLAAKMASYGEDALYLLRAVD